MPSTSSIINAFRRQSNRNRHSTASTLTNNSTKTDQYSSSTGKRAVSIVDTRSSWTPGMLPDEVKPLLAGVPPTVDEKDVSRDGSVGSTGDGSNGKRLRTITPKIQKLKAKFEFWSSETTSEKERDKENKASENRNSEYEEHLTRHSPSTNSSPLSQVDEMKVNDLPEHCTTAGDRTSMQSNSFMPLATKSHNILKSVPSVADLTKRRRYTRESKKRPASDVSSKILDLKQSRTWQDKMDRMVEWTKAGWSAGPMPDMISHVGDRSRPFDLDDNRSSSRTDSVRMLTPEEDLAECVNPSSCHPHLTPYFAKVLNDVKNILARGDKDSYDLANEANLYLIFHPCRVPLVFRIEAIHNLIELDLPSDTPMLLRLAWKMCHELETTALMVGLIHKTQQLWHDLFGGLSEMTDLVFAPPAEGYAVRDRELCQ